MRNTPKCKRMCATSIISIASSPRYGKLDFAPEGFRWIEANDADYSVYSYIRYAQDKDDFLVVVLNCTPVVRENYRIGVPERGYYRELLNSDASCYGGGDVGNAGGVHSDDYSTHGLPYSVNLRLPPLAILILKTGEG